MQTLVQTGRPATEMPATGETRYSPAFVAALDASGAWARTACAVVTLAARLGRTLDEDAILYGDIHDLQRMQVSLTRDLAQAR